MLNYSFIWYCIVLKLTLLHMFLQLLEGNFALFITYALGHRKDFQNILLVIMVSVSVLH